MNISLIETSSPYKTVLTGLKEYATLKGLITLLRIDQKALCTFQSSRFK